MPMLGAVPELQLDADANEPAEPPLCFNPIDLEDSLGACSFLSSVVNCLFPLSPVISPARKAAGIVIRQWTGSGPRNWMYRKGKVRKITGFVTIPYHTIPHISQAKSHFFPVCCGGIWADSGSVRATNRQIVVFY